MLKSHRSKMSIMYICNHEINVPSQLSPQWLCPNSRTWAHHLRFVCPTDCGDTNFECLFYKCQIYINYSRRIFFFKSVILRIFKGLLLTKSVKNYILTEQLQDKKNKKKRLLKRFPMYKLKLVIKIYKTI